MFFQPELSHAISVAEPGGTHTLPIPCVDGIVNSISGDGSRLFVQCRATPVTPSRIVAVDSSSGVAIYKEIEGAVRLAPNDAGTELYTAWSGGNQQVVFRRYDVDSGARLAEHISAAGDTGRGSMLFDSRTGHFFADAHDAVLVLDGVTLEAIPRINSPIPGAAARFVLDPDRPAMSVDMDGCAKHGRVSAPHRPHRFNDVRDVGGGRPSDRQRCGRTGARATSTARDELVGGGAGHLGHAAMGKRGEPLAGHRRHRRGRFDPGRDLESARQP